MGMYPQAMMASMGPFAQQHMLMARHMGAHAGSVHTGQVVQSKASREQSSASEVTIGSQVSTCKNTARLQMSIFKDGSQKLSSSYKWFGGVFRYGLRTVLAKKIRLSCVVWIDPEVWTPIRLASLSEDQVDMLLYCLCSTKADTRVADLQVTTKYELRDVLLREHFRLLGAHPERLSALAADLSNVAMVAWQLGYPISCMSPEVLATLRIGEAPVAHSTIASRGGQARSLPLKRMPSGSVEAEALEMAGNLQETALATQDTIAQARTGHTRAAEVQQGGELSVTPKRRRQFPAYSPGNTADGDSQASRAAPINDAGDPAEATASSIAGGTPADGTLKDATSDVGVDATMVKNAEAFEQKKVADQAAAEVDRMAALV